MTRLPPIIAALLLTATTLLAGCGTSDNDPGPGGVSAGEARALDEAAAMIESRRPPEPPATQPNDPATPAPSAENGKAAEPAPR